MVGGCNLQSSGEARKSVMAERACFGGEALLEIAADSFAEVADCGV